MLRPSTADDASWLAARRLDERPGFVLESEDPIDVSMVLPAAV